MWLAAVLAVQRATKPEYLVFLLKFYFCVYSVAYEMYLYELAVTALRIA